MYELILIILIVALAAVAFNMQARFETRMKRDEKRTQMIEELRARHEDLRTVDLIGEKAYHDMTDRIDRILREHCHQQCLTLEMTCGPDNRCCAATSCVWNHAAKVVWNGLMSIQTGCVSDGSRFLKPVLCATR